MKGVHTGMGARTAEPGVSSVCVHRGGQLATHTSSVVFWVRLDVNLDPGPSALFSWLEGTQPVCSSHPTHTNQRVAWTEQGALHSMRPTRVWRGRACGDTDWDPCLAGGGPECCQEVGPHHTRNRTASLGREPHLPAAGMVWVSGLGSFRDY